MDFIVLPTETLRDSDAPPLLLGQQSQSSGIVGAEEVLRYHLEERFREDDMPVLVMIVRVPFGVMNPATAIASVRGPRRSQ